MMKIPFTHPIHLVMGLAIWCIWFISAYGGLSIACSLVPAPDAIESWSWINILLLLFTLLAVILLLVLAVRCRRAETTCRNPTKLQAFTLRVSAAVYLFSAVATVAVGLPTIALPPCL